MNDGIFDEVLDSRSQSDYDKNRTGMRVANLRIRELEAENERLRALLTVAAINPQADPQEVRNFQIALDGAWFEREQEVEQLKEKIVAAGYRLDSSAAEIRRSREALDEMVKYQAGEMQVILPENERLRAALRATWDALDGLYGADRGEVIPIELLPEDRQQLFNKALELVGAALDGREERE